MMIFLTALCVFLSVYEKEWYIQRAFKINQRVAISLRTYECQNENKTRSPLYPIFLFVIINLIIFTLSRLGLRFGRQTVFLR